MLVPSIFSFSQSFQYAVYQHFLLFPNVFKRPLPQGSELSDKRLNQDKNAQRVQSDLVSNLLCQNMIVVGLHMNVKT